MSRLIKVSTSKQVWKMITRKEEYNHTPDKPNRNGWRDRRNAA